MSLNLERLVENDPSAAPLVQRLVRGYVRRFFMSSSQVHDVSTNAWVDLLGRLEREGAPDPERGYAWVLNSASNAVRRELTRLRRQSKTRYDSALLETGAQSESKVLRARETLRRIDELLTDCDETVRLALQARAEGRTYQEIAEQLGISHGSVRMSISRERARLRDRLSADEKLEELRLLVDRAGLSRRSTLFKSQPPSNT